MTSSLALFVRRRHPKNNPTLLARRTVSTWGAVLIMLVLASRNTEIYTTSFLFDSNKSPCSLQNPSSKIYVGGASVKCLRTIQPLLSSSSPQDYHHPDPLSCSHCGKQFETRNALFRHLRHDRFCSNIDTSYNYNNKTAFANTIFQKDVTKILFAYDSFLHEEETYDSFISKPSHAEIVSGKIIDSFNFAINEEFGGHKDSFQQTPQNQEQLQQQQQGVVSSTLVSVAKLRTHKSLSQENGISAAGDVMTLTYKYPVAQTLLDESKSFRDKKRNELFRRLKDHAIQLLEDEMTKGVSFGPVGSEISNIRILSVQLLPPDTTFHSERSCTQRKYHYLLPIRWINGGDEIENWWLENQIIDGDKGKASGTYTHSETNNVKFGRNPNQHRLSTPPKELIGFKKILKSFESEEIAASCSDNDNMSGVGVISKKRFGLLAKKSYKAWHNFADPTIRGAAVSPNNKSVWRALDRCRIVQLITYRSTKEKCDGDAEDDNAEKRQVMVIIELRGDDFVQQQVRRIIGSAVAIANGWLPSNFAEIATCPDVFIETPIAPPNHMYQTRPRFHYDELINGGKSIFQKDFDQDLETALIEDLCSRIINRCVEKHSFACQEWIKYLRDEVTPRIRVKINTQTNLDGDMATLRQMLSSNYTPAKYTKTLQILKDAASGNWPATSIARSKVIKGKDDPLKIADGEMKQNGSFTIINPKYMNGILMDQEKQSEIKVPLGNTLFPHLVDAVFQLEESLADEIFEEDERQVGMRPPSSHCAVNCNAQFTPHIDSGRGSGQSLSMIVGLGSYTGGNLCIEGESFDICYKPKQFDGWRERHWTTPFQGQRFSLVWFTPEMKGIND